MVYCLNNFEEVALRADPFSTSTPASAHPRALYMPQMSGSWWTEMAPLWTMFYEVEDSTAFSEEEMRRMTQEDYALP